MFLAVKQVIVVVPVYVKLNYDMDTGIIIITVYLKLGHVLLL